MTQLIINDLSRDYGKKSLEAPMGASVVQGASLSDIVEVLKVIGGVNWDEVEADVKKNDWLDIGFLSIEEVLTILSPWLPQAGIARGVIRLAQAIVDNLPPSNQPFNFETFSKGVLAMEGIDWNQLVEALKGDSPVMAALVTTDDLAKIVSQFVPQAGIANIVLQGLIVIAQHTHESQQSQYPGYHWDALYGWVPDKQGE